MELLFIAVLAFSAISVSRAENSLFVRKGGSVHLDVQGYEGLQFDSLSWRFSSSTTMLNYYYELNRVKLFKSYETRAEFDEKNFTLLLKNVQERDSGIYTARITDIEGKDRVVASYKLTVQEVPPTPQVRVVFLSSAGGFCNVSVNCSAKDTWASYTCVHAHCTRVANTTSPTGVNIIVTATNRAVHCSSSNRVGTKTGSESTKHVCPPIPNFPLGAIVAIVAIIIIIIIIIIVVFVIYKRRRISGGSQIQEKCNTEYASVQGQGVVLSNLSTVGTVYETVATAKPEHHPKVNTVYDLLGPAEDPPTQPESVYATVNKSAS